MRVDTKFFKIQLLRSFQITQTQANQITLKNEWVPRDIPAMNENWMKWSRIWQGGTIEIPIQFQTRNHKEEDKSSQGKDE